MASTATLSQRKSGKPPRFVESAAALTIQKVARGSRARTRYSVMSRMTAPIRSVAASVSETAEAIVSEFQAGCRKLALRTAQDTIEQVVYHNFEFIMRMMGKRLRRQLVEFDPFMFNEGKQVTGGAFDTIWPDVKAGMYSQLQDRFEKKKKTRREPSFRRQCSGCAETRC